jgi:hypothetical protein
MNGDANNANHDIVESASLDAKPKPPNAEDYSGCCDSGCSPCVYDLYWEAQARYEIALSEWQARQVKKIA